MTITNLRFVSDQRLAYVGRIAPLALGSFGNALVYAMSKMEGDDKAEKVDCIQNSVRFTLLTEVARATEQYEAVNKPLETSFAVIEKAMEVAGAKVPNATKNAHFAPCAKSWQAKLATEEKVAAFEAEMARLNKLESDYVARQAKKTGTDG